MKEDSFKLMASSMFDFSSWTSFISAIEKTSSDDSCAISKAYESFLSEYPLCYGYWKRYASHKARLSSTSQVVEVYEKAVNLATYSVDLWANYCSFAVQLFEDIDDVRRLFKRGLSFVGKDYRASILLDQWLAFEHSNKQWNRLVDVYIKSLRYPTKRLHHYYQSFKTLTTRLEEEIGYQTACMDAPEELSGIDFENMSAVADSKISRAISGIVDRPADLYKSQTLKTILIVGEYFYHRSSDINEKIGHFESHIQRHYFHVNPLDLNELQNWHQYLDFVEAKDDFDSTVKLYERCLIPCANYPVFWVRYIEHMEANGGRELATHAIERAEKIFFEKVPRFHEYCSKVKEHIGDSYGAQGSFHCTDSRHSPYFIDSIIQQANLEKRLGNLEKANGLYLKGINMLKDKQDLQGFCLLYTHFARFKYLVTSSARAARDVFVEAISGAPHCKLIYERFITFMSTHCNKGDVCIVDSVVAPALLPNPGASLALSPSDREEVSKLFLEFVDLCGNPQEIRKAWARHLRFFPPTVQAAEVSNLWEAARENIMTEEQGTGAQNTEENSKAIGEGAQADKQPQEKAISIIPVEKEKPNEIGQNLQQQASISPANKMGQNLQQRASISPANETGQNLQQRASISPANEMGQNLQQQASISPVHLQIQHQQNPIYCGFEQAWGPPHPRPNYVPNDRSPVPVHYQQYQYPVVWQDENLSGSNQHNPQLQMHDQYQAQYWHHYYQQQQLYYVQQQQEGQHQQQLKNQPNFHHYQHQQQQ